MKALDIIQNNPRMYNDYIDWLLNECDGEYISEENTQEYLSLPFTRVLFKC